MQTIIEKVVKKGKQKLFAAFIDFKKAYDTVDRNLLLARLRGCLYGSRAGSEPGWLALPRSRQTLKHIQNDESVYMETGWKRAGNGPARVGEISLPEAGSRQGGLVFSHVNTLPSWKRAGSELEMRWKCDLWIMRECEDNYAHTSNQ